MQITIDVPDNLPHSFIRQGIAAFKEKLNQLQDNEEFKIDPQACLDALEK